MQGTTTKVENSITSANLREKKCYTMLTCRSVHAIGILQTLQIKIDTTRKKTNKQLYFKPLNFTYKAIHLAKIIFHQSHHIFFLIFYTFAQNTTQFWNR